MMGQGGAEGQNRTADTRIFSPLLYQLSYLGLCATCRAGHYMLFRASSQHMATHTRVAPTSRSPGDPDEEVPLAA